MSHIVVKMNTLCASIFKCLVTWQTDFLSSARPSLVVNGIYCKQLSQAPAKSVHVHSGASYVSIILIS